MSNKRQKLTLDATSRLNKRIILQSPNNVDDGGGGVTKGWQDTATVWAELKPVSGREAFRHGKLEASITHRAVIRYRDDVIPSMRVRYGARYFNIRAVENTYEHNALLELVLEEGVAI